MANDRVQFRRAEAKYQELLGNHQFSIPDEPGSTTAILVAYTDLTNQPGDRSRAPEDDYAHLEAEGYAVAARVARDFRQPELRLRATVDDLREVLHNRNISAVALIALGGLSAAQFAQPYDSQLANLPSGREDGWVSWYDVAVMADHLKMGRGWQRFCGSRSRKLNVPFFWGAFADHRDIWAPASNDFILPRESLGGDGNMQSVTNIAYLGYEAIKSLFPRSDRQDHGPLINSLPDSVYRLGSQTVRSVRSIHSGEREL